MAVPQNAFASAAALRLTLLSPQGLPNLLPLGFAPVVAFDLREDGGQAPALPLPATASGLGSVTGPLHLVAYRPNVHAWVAVAPGLTADAGTVAFTLPALGAYALVTADPGDPPVAVPDAGQPLAGVPMVAIPTTATSHGAVAPAVLPPTGGMAEGTLTLVTPQPLPSGTVVKAEVTESYTLATGDEASEEKRSHDIVLFRGETAHVGRDIPPAEPPVPGAPPVEPTAPTTQRLTPCATTSPGATALCAAFPITPARSFATDELTEGKVHLDILAGREGVRGTVGGTEATRVESAGGEAAVFVPAQALPRTTAITVETQGLSSYLPATGGVVPLAEVVVDFSGETLALGAELSVVSPGVGPGDTLVEGILAVSGSSCTNRTKADVMTTK